MEQRKYLKEVLVEMTMKLTHFFSPFCHYLFIAREQSVGRVLHNNVSLIEMSVVTLAFHLSIYTNHEKYEILFNGKKFNQ